MEPKSVVKRKKNIQLSIPNNERDRDRQLLYNKTNDVKLICYKKNK